MIEPVRITEIQRVLVDQLRILGKVITLMLNNALSLETMTPSSFLEFREVLTPASGFQSFQFRCDQFLSLQFFTALSVQKVT